MKKINVLIALTMVFAYLFPTIANTWNYTGHVLIAQIAYNNLQPQTKKKADELATIIFNQLPSYQQEKINRKFKNASTFAKIAILPDVWRKWNLATIFIKFHAIPPFNMFLWLNESTANWHYTDQPYPLSKHCRIIESSNVVWAIQKLEMNLAHTKKLNSKALEMVLLEHYIGDIHQPLHNFTNVTNSCMGDRGGNNFCLKENRHGKCVKNLHSLWDAGVGYLKPHANIQALAYKLQRLYPPSQFNKQLIEKNPQLWSKENLTFAPFVYSTREYSKPIPEYFYKGQMIATSQITLAGYRLAEILNEIL